MPLHVRNQRTDAFHVLVQQAQGRVAPMTQQSANSAGYVVVVDVHVLGIGMRPAGLTRTIDHRYGLLACQPIGLYSEQDSATLKAWTCRSAIARLELVQRICSAASDAHLCAVYDPRNLPEWRQRDVITSLPAVAAA
jgi:hypothetical protein